MTRLDKCFGCWSDKNNDIIRTEYRSQGTPVLLPDRLDLTTGTDVLAYGALSAEILPEQL